MYPTFALGLLEHMKKSNTREKTLFFIDCISLFYNKQQGRACFHFENGEFSLQSPFDKLMSDF